MHEPHRNYDPHRGDPAAPTNPGLLNAMYHVARSDGPETRSALYSAILGSTLILPLAEPPSGRNAGFVTLDDDEPINLVLLQDLNGRVLLPAFTDTTALFAWQPDNPSYAELPALDVLRLALGEGIQAIVVNVAGPTGGEISRHEIEVLAQGALPQADGSFGFADDARITITYPRELPPDELIVRLSNNLAEHPQVEAGYVAEAVFPDGENHLLAGIAFDPAPGDEVVSEIMTWLVASVRDIVPPGVFLDFVPLVDGGPFAEAIRSSGLTIYRRA